MLKLLIDTCVWIDLAKDHHQHTFLRALDTLMKEGKVSVIIPPLIRDEFQRNKDNIVGTNRASLSSALKRAKELLDQHGQASKTVALEELNAIDQRLPRLGDLSGMIAFVERILDRAETIPVTDAAKLRAVERGVAKKAPFHSKKNSVADAILIEAFADVVKGKGTTGHQFGFVTHNKNDFSVPNGDQRQPHADFADIFTKRKVRYFATLKDALLTVQSGVLEGLQDEEYTYQPRTTDEIIALVNELADKTWYNRHKMREQLVNSGKIKIGDDTGPGSIKAEIWEGALRSAKKVEEKFGKDNIIPNTDVEWGMVLGKLSALRWVLGEDWEFTLDG